MRDRNKFPPGGWRFLQPQIARWSVTPWSSFDQCVQQIIQVRAANPLITQNNHLSLDPGEVADELEQYNYKVCAEMGWTQFIWDGEGEPPPKYQSPLSLLGKSAQLAAGVRTLAEWEIAGGNLVPQELADKRAEVCSSCPKNESGDLTSWFTIPAARLIANQLESRNNMKIHTTRDPLLGVCTACACPLRLKVHCPIDIVNSKLRTEDRERLDPRCWILSETQ